MFVIRELLNRDEILEWAIAEGFRKIVPAETLHVTIGKFHDPKVAQRLIPTQDGLEVRANRRRAVLNFGGIIVLAFGCSKLSRRHAEFRRAGMIWFYQSYTPHVSFALDNLDLRGIRPFDGRLRFGPELFKQDPILDYFPEGFRVWTDSGFSCIIQTRLAFCSAPRNVTAPLRWMPYDQGKGRMLGELLG